MNSVDACLQAERSCMGERNDSSRKPWLHLTWMMPSRSRRSRVAALSMSAVCGVQDMIKVSAELGDARLAQDHIYNVNVCCV
jgi:hypothetical protein